MMFGRVMEAARADAFAGLRHALQRAVGRLEELS